MIFPRKLETNQHVNKKQSLRGVLNYRCYEIFLKIPIRVPNLKLFFTEKDFVIDIFLGIF